MSQSGKIESRKTGKSKSSSCITYRPATSAFGNPSHSVHSIAPRKKLNTKSTNGHTIYKAEGIENSKLASKNTTYSSKINASSKTTASIKSQPQFTQKDYWRFYPHPSPSSVSKTLHKSLRFDSLKPARTLKPAPKQDACPSRAVCGLVNSNMDKPVKVCSMSPRSSCLSSTDDLFDTIDNNKSRTYINISIYK